VPDERDTAAEDLREAGQLGVLPRAAMGLTLTVPDPIPSRGSQVGMSGNATAQVKRPGHYLALGEVRHGVAPRLVQ